MSISPIITEGYGSFGSVAYVVTLGFLAGTAPVVGGDTHDGMPYRVDDWKKHLQKLKRQESELLRNQQRKLDERKQLREQIDEALNPKPIETFADKIQAAAASLNPKIEPLVAQHRMADIEEELEKLNQELLFHRMKDLRMRQRMEDEIILLLI